MGAVEFECECGGGVFPASTDNRSYVAHYIADQDYDEFSTLVDDGIEKSGPSNREKDAACMAWRKFQMPLLWQCRNCGTLFVEDQDRQRHKFVPHGRSVPKALFARRDQKSV